MRSLTATNRSACEIVSSFQQYNHQLPITIVDTCWPQLAAAARPHFQRPQAFCERPQAILSSTHGVHACRIERPCTKHNTRATASSVTRSCSKCVQSPHLPLSTGSAGLSLPESQCMLRKLPERSQGQAHTSHMQGFTPNSSIHPELQARAIW